MADYSFTISSEEIAKFSKDKVIYVLDKDFLKKWILQGNDLETRFINSLMDLFLSLRLKWNVPIVIPVDVLIELDKEGHKVVKDPAFLSILNFLGTIIEVNPADTTLTAKDAVITLAKKYKDIPISYLITTPSPELYQEYDLNVAKASNIFFAMALFYKILPTELKQIIDNWLKQR
jgi:hypothetical protein